MSSIAYDGFKSMIQNYYPNYASKLEHNAETVFKEDMQNRVNYLFEEKLNNIRQQRCALLRIKPEAAINDAENYTLVGCSLPEVEFWAVLKIKATHSKQFVKDLKTQYLDVKNFVFDGKVKYNFAYLKMIRDIKSEFKSHLDFYLAHLDDNESKIFFDYQLKPSLDIFKSDPALLYHAADILTMGSPDQLISNNLSNAYAVMLGMFRKMYDLLVNEGYYMTYQDTDAYGNVRDFTHIGKGASAALINWTFLIFHAFKFFPSKTVFAKKLFFFGKKLFNESFFYIHAK